MSGPRVTAIVVAHGAAPWLHQATTALLSSVAVDLDVIVVDNGCPEVEAIRDVEGVTVVDPGANLGFAGGCNEAALRARGDVLVLVNPDAVVTDDAIAELCKALAPGDVGVATASLRLADAPDRLNSAGNVIHFLGFGWVGGFGEPADHYIDASAVTSGSGAAMAIPRAIWQKLGGLNTDFFAYHEDAEFSWRCWQQDLRVVFVPSAVVIHHYDFRRNPTKLELLERNRVQFVLTVYEARTILLLLPLLLACELGIVLVAARGGWARQKVSTWGWLWRNRARLAARRRLVQGSRHLPDREIAGRLAWRIDPANMPLPIAVQRLDGVLAGYWRLVRRLL